MLLSKRLLAFSALSHSMPDISSRWRPRLSSRLQLLAEASSCWARYPKICPAGFGDTPMSGEESGFTTSLALFGLRLERWTEKGSVDILEGWDGGGGVYPPKKSSLQLRYSHEFPLAVRRLLLRS